jgi:hypothetical protein
VSRTFVGYDAVTVCAATDLFVTELIDCDLSAATVRKYLYGVRDYLVRRTGVDPIPAAYADKLLLKARHTCTAFTRSAQPFAPAWLRTVRHYHGHIYFTACLIMYTFLLRFSEAAPTPSRHFLRARHVRVVTSPSGARSLTVTILSSKTDQEGVGSTHGRDEIPGSDLCPVAAWTTYERLVPPPASPDSPALRDVAGRNLTRSAMTTVLRDTMARLGIHPDLYSLHSFRSGAATAAVSLKVPRAWLMREGRWKDEKSLEPYVKLAHGVTAPAFASVLLLGTPR